MDLLKPFMGSTSSYLYSKVDAVSRKMCDQVDEELGWLIADLVLTYSISHVV